MYKIVSIIIYVLYGYIRNIILFVFFADFGCLFIILKKLVRKWKKYSLKALYIVQELCIKNSVTLNN